ncbi:response regulator [Sphingomonas glacialis]|nr:response regulator [Sphingomonas glacialis]
MTERASGSALLNVLVVEDDRHIAAIIEVSLRLDPGIAVQVVDTGTDAIEVLTHGVIRFDLILLDGTLPDMSGQQLAQIIARHPGLASVPIIILTAALSTEGLDAYRATGVLAVMTKPFNPLTLARDLRSRITHGTVGPRPIV